MSQPYMYLMGNTNARCSSANVTVANKQRFSDIRFLIAMNHNISEAPHNYSKQEGMKYFSGCN